MNNRLSLFFISSTMLSISACVNTSTQRSINIHEIQQAETFIQQGQHQQAAKLYKNIAYSAPEQSNQYKLLAAKSFIQSGDNYNAEDMLNSISSSVLSPQQRNQLHLLKAQIYLSSGDAEQALQSLLIIQPYTLKPAKQINYYQSLAFAQSLAGQYFDGVESRIKLSSLLTNSTEKYNNNLVIFNTLKQLPAHQLNAKKTAINDTLNGWINLTQILQNTTTSANNIHLQNTLNEWARQFPLHPAHTDFLATYQQSIQPVFSIPNKIAVLLPESGRFAQAAKAIKEGILLAYQENQHNFQPELKFYDTSSFSPVEIYQQTQNEGINMIIGPLSKENIETLVSSVEITTPILALNHIPALKHPKLLQFGLSPIDDSNQITQQARLDNKQKALVLTPGTEQGNRISESIQTAWQASDGIILETQSYNPQNNDFSKPIKALLNIDESNYRYRQLKKRLRRNIEFTERRRQDSHLIFLSAYPTTARSIYPQLRFYHAADLPVYATSQIYSGRPNPTFDIDLNSITFCDIPWLFPDETNSNTDTSLSLNNQTQLPNPYLRLFALGLDSFNLIPQLETLNNTPYQGATGLLSLDSNNRVTRQLICSKFNSGTPRLIEPPLQLDELTQQNIAQPTDDIE